MIYALIIILCLVIIFTILIRRLPKALKLVENKSEKQTQDTTFNSISIVTNIRSALKPLARLWQSYLTWQKISLRSLKHKTARFIIKWQQRSKARNLPEKTVQIKNSDINSSSDLQTTSIPESNNKKSEQFWQKEHQTPHDNFQPNNYQSQMPAQEPVQEPTEEKKVEIIEERNDRTRNISQEAEDAFAIKDYRKAERLLLRLATSEPKNPKIYSKLGVIYLEQKNFEDARDALQAAIKIEPNIPTRHYNLALTYLQLGSRAKAIISMEEALRYEPSNRKYRKMLDDILANRI